MRAILLRGADSYLLIALIALLATAFFYIFNTPRVLAQVDNTGIALTYVISGTVPVSGDLISFDRMTQSFHLTKKYADRDVYGVVVTNPIVLLRKSAEGTPIVTTGEAYVNVTTANGPISVGDSITASPVPGKGQRADEDETIIIGTALTAFPDTASTTTTTLGTSTTTNTKSVYSGSVQVLLDIGPRSIGDGKGPGTGKSTTTPPAVPNPLSSGNKTGVSAPIAILIKYLLAATVVLGSIYVAFRNFGSNMKDSIVSVGRNPLAKTSIQSMVVINTVLIILVSAVGLFIGLMILFVQL